MALRPQHRHAPARARGELEEGVEIDPGRRRKPVAGILVPLAENLQVQRQHERRAPRRLGPIDQVMHELAVPHHIELEPERRPAGRFGHVLDRTDAHGRKCEGNSERPRGFGSKHLAIGVLHAAEPRGRDGDRHRDLFPRHRRGQRAIGHVHGHALAKLDLLEVGFVGAIGAFRPGPGIRVIEEHARHAPPGARLELVDRLCGKPHRPMSSCYRSLNSGRRGRGKAR